MTREVKTDSREKFGYDQLNRLERANLSDGSFGILHHLGQDSRGALVEASTRYHGVGKYGQDILHSQFGRSKPHPVYPINRRQFDVDTREYWKTRCK